MSKLDLYLKGKKKRAVEEKRGPILPGTRPEYLPRRNTGVYLNFWDLGQVWNGSDWEDLDFVATPTITEGTGIDPPYMDTVASLDSSNWDDYKDKLFEVPLEDWGTTYRKLTYEDAYRYGIDVYLGNPADVDAGNQPNHVDLSKYYLVASDWQRPPVDYYLQGSKRALRVISAYSAGATSLTVEPTSSPHITIPSGTKLCFSRDNIVTTTSDVTTSAFNTVISISPLAEDVAAFQHFYIYFEDQFVNRNMWTAQGLRVTPSDYFNLITFNSFMNLGLWFESHITSVNDPGAAAVPFTLNRSTDFFLVPALVGNEHISAWDPIGPLSWGRNSYLNMDFRPWSRSQFLSPSYFEEHPNEATQSYRSRTPVDCPVFAKGGFWFSYEYNGLETIPLPSDWQSILDYYKTVTDARQFKEGGGVGLTSTTDFAVSPQAQLWLGSWGAINSFDITPDSNAYVTPGSLLAVAKQGNDYFYFWYNGTEKINDQYDVTVGGLNLMQRLQVEYNYADA